jgi:hypothetical protein
MSSRGKIKKLIREQRELEQKKSIESVQNYIRNSIDDYFNFELSKLFNLQSETNYNTSTNYVDNSDLLNNQEFKKLLENRLPLFDYKIVKVNKFYFPAFFQRNKARINSLKTKKLKCLSVFNTNHKFFGWKYFNSRQKWDFKIKHRFKIVPNKVIVNHMHKVIYAPTNIYDKLINAVK